MIMAHFATQKLSTQFFQMEQNMNLTWQDLPATTYAIGYVHVFLDTENSFHME